MVKPGTRNAKRVDGQTVTEFVLMLALLTAIGILIWQRFVGVAGEGAFPQATATAANRIAGD